jgi:hypothetical protein
MFFRKLSSAWAGGAAGALVALGMLWLFGRAGVLGALDIGLRADLSAGGLYRLMVWGGIWGFLLLLPVWRGAPLSRGALFSLAPSAAILLIYFPKIGRGYFGMEYGLLAPGLILILGIAWGVFAALWHRSC